MLYLIFFVHICMHFIEFLGHKHHNPNNKFKFNTCIYEFENFTLSLI